MAEHPSQTDYPIVLQLVGRLVVIVGGGRVGRRKLRGVLNAGAHARVIDPSEPDESLHEMVEYLQRPYRQGDLIGADLVFACTDDPETNRAVAAEAKTLSTWCCCSDQPHDSDFALPAVLRRGPLTVAVSTRGGSPAMSALLRDEISENITESWGKAVEIIAAIRRKWLTEHTEVQYNQEVLRNLLDQELIPLISRNQIKKIDQLLLAHFGPGFSLSELHVQINEGAL